MTSATHTQTLIDKLRELPREQLAEIEDFVDFLRQRHSAGRTSRERLSDAIDAGRVAAPAAGCERSSVSNAPPVTVPGTPPSEIVLRDRR